VWDFSALNFPTSWPAHRVIRVTDARRALTHSYLILSAEPSQ
jgi:hypothetical protein